MHLAFCQPLGERGLQEQKGSVVRTAALGVVFLITLLTFYPSVHFGFVNWDDEVFVTSNRHIQRLDLEHLKKIFTSLEGACYAPLSSLSIAVDHFLWRGNAFGFHLTNVVLHSVNACLVVLIALFCFRKIGCDPRLSLIQAVLSAVIFAIHPMRVESVAWISERRDVLSGFFGLSALYTYFLYASEEGRKVQFYWMTMFLFGAGVLSKASVVALPLIFLILDVYLLRRLKLGELKNQGCTISEKLPFFMVGGLAGLFAIHAQMKEGAVPAAASFNSIEQLKLIGVSNFLYLKKIFGLVFPLNPLDLIHRWTLQESMIPWTILIIIGVAVFIIGRNSPGVWIACIIYLVLILPFAGLFKVGNLVGADRYTYLASIPLGMVVSGAAGRFAGRSFYKPRSLVVLGLSVALVSSLIIRAQSQLRIWSSSEKLWTTAVQLDPQNVYAWRKLGDAHLKSNRLAQAEECFKKAFEILPGDADAAFDLAYVEGRLEKFDAAIPLYQNIVFLKPKMAKAWFNLAELEAKEGKLDSALMHFLQAAEIEPDAATYYNIAICYEGKSDVAKAKMYYEKARSFGK